MKLKSILTLVVAVLALNTAYVYAEKLSKGEWYVQLILESDDGTLKDPYNKLGQMRGASPWFDPQDLPELGQTFGGTYLSVIFNRPDWGTEEQTYNTDFHPVRRNAGEEWTFEVRSDDPYRSLSLTWAGKRTKMKRMVLVDLQENEMVPAVVDGVPQTYNFIMNGPVREFAWRVLTKKQYNQFLASSEATANAVEPELARVSLLSVNGVSNARSATSESLDTATQSSGSGWEPKGWGQGQGKGFTANALDGLPENPFAE
jgi:hypothetical protein